MYIMSNGNRPHKHTTIGKLLPAVIAVFVFVLYTQPPLLTMADTDTFITNLRLGDRGENVLRLQTALNTDPRTKVADSSFGSPGHETTYFGPLTKAAVIRFQELYVTEVLVPVGLTRGTGFFGPSSRAKLNAILRADFAAQEKETESIAPSESAQTIPIPIGSEQLQNQGLSEDALSLIPEDFGKIYLSYPSSYEGEPGHALSLQGVGFTQTNNTVHFGTNYSVQNVMTTNGVLLLSVPEDIPYGYYPITVSNSGGTSLNDIPFVVKTPNTPNPTISKVTPERIGYGDMVTVTGTGFSTKGNEIRSSYDIMRDIVSLDGKTIKFNVLPFPDTFGASAGTGFEKGTEWEIRFYVINENGISSNQGIITLVF